MKLTNEECFELAEYLEDVSVLDTLSEDDLSYEAYYDANGHLLAEKEYERDGE